MRKSIFATFAPAVAKMHSQRGMTGLETAIILIAFVTVAAVFGYAVLSAGLFSAERAKETVYAGLQQAKANMELSGSVIVYTDNATATDPARAKTVLFTVRNAIAGTPIDMTPNLVGAPGLNRCIISMVTADNYTNNINWSVAAIGVSDNDTLLESGEQFEITIDLTTFPAIHANDWFNIQVKPMLGSYMTIQRTLPAGLDPIMDMH